MKLTHIGISQFRSVGAVPVMIDLAKRVTVLVGQNECGKSGVLHGIERMSKMLSDDRPRLEIVDFHKCGRVNPPQAHLRATGEENDAKCYRESGPFTISGPIATQLNENVSSQEIAALNIEQLADIAATHGKSLRGFPLSDPI